MFLVVLVVSQSGCMYRMGAELAAGMFDESTGERKSKGMDSVTQPLVEKAIVRELGRQLGQGLTSGIGTVSDEQRASLEATVDGILATATSRTGRGLREDVSPELREMIRKDVIGALSEGLRGELGSSLEETVEKVINKASRSLVQGFQDPDLRIAISESLRDAVYMAVREGRPGSPAVGETLQATLSENVLDPFENSVSGIADRVASQVDKSAQRTETVLKTVISALIVILGVFAVMYGVTRRQLQRARENSQSGTQSPSFRNQSVHQSVRAAVELVDDTVRKNVMDATEPPDDRSKDT